MSSCYKPTDTTFRKCMDEMKKNSVKQWLTILIRWMSSNFKDRNNVETDR